MLIAWESVSPVDSVSEWSGFERCLGQVWAGLGLTGLDGTCRGLERTCVGLDKAGMDRTELRTVVPGASATSVKPGQVNGGVEQRTAVTGTNSTRDKPDQDDDGVGTISGALVPVRYTREVGRK